MKASFAAVTPTVYGVRSYLCQPNPKTQYACRLVGVLAGKAVCCLTDNQTNVQAGSVLFVCPGDMLSITDESEGFDAVEVFFDFVPYRVGLARRADECVGEEQFNPLLCSPVADFTDTDAFAASCVLHCPETVALLRAMQRYAPDGAFAPLAFKGLLCASLADLACGNAGHISSERARTAAEIIAYIGAHVDAGLSPKSVAEAFGFHVNYVNSLVRAQTGMPLGTYIKSAKLRTADRMLAEGTLTLSQIAKKLGYFDYSHFYKAYRSVYGHAPVRTGDGVTDAANTLPSDADDGI